MFRVVIEPQNLEAMLLPGSCLTELEFELYGLESVTFGCKSGACGACVVEVLDGIDYLGDVGNEEARFLLALGYREGVFRLACQCRIQGDIRISTAAKNK